MEMEMAQKVNVLLVDDIDGSEADETLPFGLDGTNYEIDLNSEHAQQLRASWGATSRRPAKSQHPPSPRGSARPDERQPEQGDTQLGQGARPGRQRSGPHPCRHHRQVQSGQRHVSQHRTLQPGAIMEVRTSSAAGTTSGRHFPGLSANYPSVMSRTTRTASGITGIAVRVLHLVANTGY